MAVTIFSKQAGQITSFIDPSMPARASINLEGWGGYTELKSIITNVVVASQGNFQFLHTMGGNIYVYVFGDRLGQISISGLSMETDCNDGGTIGVERVLQYYNSNRLAGRKTPIKVTIGVATTLTAYLTGVGASVQDTKSRLWQFTLSMGLIPITVKRKKGDSEGEVGYGGGEGGSETTPVDPPSLPYPRITTSTFDVGGASTNVASTTTISSDGYAMFGTGPNIDLVR